MASSTRGPRRLTRAGLALCALTMLAGAAHAKTDACRAGASALSDAKAIAGVRGAIARACPCADFDASTPEKTHSTFVKCAKAVITDATDGTPRVVDRFNPNPAFPTFGGVGGGFEVVMAEGFAHLDVVTADDNADNPIPAALLAFLQRNIQ
jgi:hypothetical protein